MFDIYTSTSKTWKAFVFKLYLLNSWQHGFANSYYSIKIVELNFIFLTKLDQRTTLIVFMFLTE